MKNYFKKFSIMFVMSLILMLGCSVTVFADDNYEIGIKNFNNTINNSAKIGDDLKQPEKGWKRYDDSNSCFICSKSLIMFNSSVSYKGTLHGLIDKNQSYAEIKFKFYGSKLRLITNMWSDHSKKIYVDIDGTVETYDPSVKNQEIVLSYEKLGVNLGYHNVKIYTDVKSSIVNGLWFGLDAIDIDDTGYLVNPNESIVLDKSTMNLTEGDSGKLTAITTPSAVGVTWTSSDSSIATIEVDPTNGKLIKVNAIKEGTCTITATTADGSNLSASCILNVAKKTEPIPDPQQTESDKIVNIAHAKGDNTNNAGGDVTIIFHGSADTTLSVVKTADVKDVWVGDNFTYTIVVTNTGTKTAKAVVVSDPAPNHIDFNVSGVTTTQGSVDSRSTSKNIIVNVGDIPPTGTITIKVPATVIA